MDYNKKIYTKLNNILKIYNDDIFDEEILLKRLDHLTDVHLSELEKHKTQIEETSLILEAQFEEISRTYEELTTVLDISKIIFSKKDPRLSLDMIVKRLKDSISFKNIIIGEFVDLEKHSFAFKPLFIELTDLNFEKIDKIVSKLESQEKAKTILEENDEKNNSYLLIPIKSTIKLWGFILLYSKKDTSFFLASEKKIMESVSEQIAFGFDTIDYMQDKIEQQIFNEQLKIAKDIQKSLLPSVLPKIHNADIAAYYRSAFDVGGDYYDLIKLNENESFSILADVSGKGVPAALIMSSFRAVIRSRLELNDSIEEVVKYVNNYLAKNIPNDRFVTAVFVYLNTLEKRVKLINAGHNVTPIIIDEKLIYSDADGLPLGIIEDYQYTNEEYAYEKNLFITLYTDGITEARDPQKNEYDVKRLEDLIISKKQENADVIVNSIIESVDNFSKGAPQHDDTTLLIIKGY